MPGTFAVKPKPEMVEAYKNEKVFNFVFGEQGVSLKEHVQADVDASYKSEYKADEAHANGVTYEEMEEELTCQR